MDDLVEKLSALLLEKDLKLVTAESCTGGMVSALVTSRAGSSAVFDRGFVTYSDESKQDHLGVSFNILNHYGAVSAQCADAMVFGALKNSRASIALSITGIAGPDGGTEDKPVGLVYIGVGIIGKEPHVTECRFSGSRNDIREQTCHKALSLLIETVVGA